MSPAAVSFRPEPANFRRLCCWCHCDLGPLAHPMEHDSYAICEPCQYRYFPHLYEDAREDVKVDEKPTEVLQERAVGA